MWDLKQKAAKVYIFLDYLPSSDEESSISATEATDANGKWHQPSQYAQRPTPKSLFFYFPAPSKKKKNIFFISLKCVPF